jgi:uncharacterized repeat protein (TIGR03803 family)
MLASMLIFAAAVEKLYSFRGAPDGAQPFGALAMDRSGALYGTTSQGGSAGCGCGTVFRLAPSGKHYRETYVYSFSGLPDGSTPLAAVVADAAGNLYGTTNAGGASNLGTVFELSPSGSGYVETILHSFSGQPDGRNPQGALIADASGTLYGTTSAGGSSNNGTAFALVPGASGYTEHVIYSFKGYNDGQGPVGRLLEDASGNLFGSTDAGGPSGAGTVFRLSPQGSSYAESVLFAFDSSDGFYPLTGLIEDAAGNLFGSTFFNGPANAGNIFELSPGASGYAFASIDGFTQNHDGANPHGDLVFGKRGTIFATTEHGGAYGSGTILKLTPGYPAYDETIIFNFPASPFGGPQAGLIADEAGNFYGTSAGGGAHGEGFAFKVLK